MDEKKNHGMEHAPNHGEGTKNQDYVGIEPDSSRNEEFASEFTADDQVRENRGDSAHVESEVNTMYGWIGIILAIASFFMWPIILGGAGVILGFVSRSRGADTLGNVAIAGGAISIIISLFIIPFV